MRRAGGTSALLDRVNSTLRGDKNKEEDDEGLGAYLSGLSKKNKFPQNVKAIDWENIDNLDDLSENEDKTALSSKKNVPLTGSKFLKKKHVESDGAKLAKKANNENQASKTLKPTKYETKSKVQKDAFRGLSDSDMDISFSTDGVQIYGDVENLTPAIIPRAKSPDKSLSDDSMNIGKSGNKFLKKQNAVKAQSIEEHHPIKRKTEDIPNAEMVAGKKFGGNQHFLSTTSKSVPRKDSNLESTNSSVPSVKFQQNKFQKSAVMPSKDKYNLQEKSRTFAVDGDDDSSSMSLSIGKGGSRFMKKKTEETKNEVNKEEKTPKIIAQEDAINGDKEKLMNTKKKDMFSLKSAEKYSTTVQLDSEDESLKGYIHNLAESNSSPEVSLKTPPKSPKTPRGILKTPRTSRSLTTLEDIDEHEDELKRSHSSDSDSFKINVLDLDALDPPDFSPPEATNASTPKPGVKLQAKKSHEKTKSSKKEIHKTQKKKKNQSKKPDSKEYRKQSTVASTVSDDDSDDLFAKMGLQTVDDLLGNMNKSVSSESDITTDIERTQEVGGYEDGYEEDFDTASVARSPSPLRGILSPSPKPDKTPRSGRTPRVRYSLEEVTEVRSRSPSPEIIYSAPASRSASIVYTVDFEDDSESVIRTEPSETEDSIISERIGTSKSAHKRYNYGRSRSESEYYSSDFTSATESRWASKRKEYERSKNLESVDSEYSMYSDTFSEYSESRNDSRREKKKSRKRNEVEIQTGASLADLAYQWLPQTTGTVHVTPGYGLKHLDPKLVATHVVSADALEALTTYSPSMMALNEMMKEQLKITENYITTQRHLHESLIHSTQPDFIYTTLEDTKRYIKKHRKPTLTFKEALKQVKEDMGLA